jgi:hypothetical protein
VSQNDTQNANSSITSVISMTPIESSIAVNLTSSNETDTTLSKNFSLGIETT